MIVSAVADPAIFGPLGITDKLAEREATSFLQGIISNGILVDEPSKALLREAMVQSLRLGTRLGQRIQLLLTEIEKQQSKLVHRCPGELQRPPSAGGNEAKRLAALATLRRVDVVVTVGERVSLVAAAVQTHTEVIGISELSDSQYESRRQSYVHIEKPLDALPAEAAKELIQRAVMYASVLRIYDFRMVGSLSRIRNYAEGIGYVAAIWEQCCVAAAPRAIELYTANIRTTSGTCDKAELNRRLGMLVGKLKELRITANIDASIKQDTDPPIFHARGFEAGQRAYTIDPGFDALGLIGPTRRCLFKYEKAAEQHFSECRRLKEA